MVGIVPYGLEFTLRLRLMLGFALAGLGLTVAWQFLPPPTQPPPLPRNSALSRAAWIGVEWVMDPHTDAEIEAFAAELLSLGIGDAYLYTSYLRPEGTFNPTFDHAASFTERMRQAAPGIRLLAWVGVPIHVTGADGERVDRLDNAAVRAQIAEFAAFSVTTLGFDGFHLNAELAENADQGYLLTIDAIRAALPAGAPFSVTAQSLRLTLPVTLSPYPQLAHHWTPEFLRAIADRVDQIALMAYDSGLLFPTDYRKWVAFQVYTSSVALADSATDLIIGLPTSEEWTPSHQTQAETLSNALYGLLDGVRQSNAPIRVTGIAVYPYWETSADEWMQIQESLGSAGGG